MAAEKLPSPLFETGSCPRTFRRESKANCGTWPLPTQSSISLGRQSSTGGGIPRGPEKALRAALDNPNVDFVLALGAGVSIAAAEVLLSKPVVATFVQRPDFGAIHEQANDRSQTENLAFMAIPQLPRDRSRVTTQSLPVSRDRSFARARILY